MLLKMGIKNIVRENVGVKPRRDDISIPTEIPVNVLNAKIGGVRDTMPPTITNVSIINFFLHYYSKISLTYRSNVGF